MPRAYGLPARITTTAVCLSFVPLGLLFAVLAFASTWGGGAYWAQLTLLFGGVGLAGIAAVAAIHAWRTPPTHLAIPGAVLLAACLVAVVGL